MTITIDIKPELVAELIKQAAARDRCLASRHSRAVAGNGV